MEKRIWKKEFRSWERKALYQTREQYKSSPASLAFATLISNADVIRRAQSDHCPLIAYQPQDGNTRAAKERYQQEWNSLVHELLERIREKR